MSMTINELCVKRAKAWNDANPYRSDIGSMSWEQGAIRNLPYSHMELIVQLLVSGNTSIGYITSDGSAYVSATRLSTCNVFPEKDVILCISMPLGTVDVATGILQIQLMWMSILSFVLAFVLEQNCLVIDQLHYLQLVC